MVALTCVLGLIIGAAFGAARPPTYKATATLYVGKTLSLSNTAAIAGLGTVAANIAEDYARLIDTSTVTKGAAAIQGTSGLGGSLTATEIPQTPEIQVTGSATTAAAAVRLANAGARSLVKDVTSLNVYSSSTLKGLEQTYTSLEVQITEDQDKVNSLQNRSAHATGSELASLQTQVGKLEATISRDTLQASTIESQYQNDYSPYTAEEQVLQIASPAASATSDRHKSVELGLVGGLVLGFLVGVAWACYVDIRASRREGGSPRPSGRQTA